MQIWEAKWVKSLFNEYALFFISLCVLFWWLGTGSLTWKRISIPLFIGGYYLWKAEVYRFIRRIPLAALLPIAAALLSSSSKTVVEIRIEITSFSSFLGINFAT